MNQFFLSHDMIDSEATMVYSTAYNSNLQNTNCFTLSSSQSQGFAWNQDLFASQYQQMCKVVYDGHEDSLEGLMEYIRKNTKRQPRWNRFAEDDGMKYDDDDEALTDCEVEVDEEEISEPRCGSWGFFSRSHSGHSLHPRVSEELNRPRRISERSLSFVSDSKNGNYNRCDTAIVEVESDTPENNHLKWLVGIGKNELQGDR
ncbi:UGX2 (YDL169C) [Zygosaccharomyces parabailii]|uniref:ZYBA0S10-02652g1_1 n=1 Tax=Zygosaccharomyces bailii (strain CLIB 213 / ATCC 58445 / CBS 680 / BCRC 21525 / NBRC 1098 / NCYC 1416 / NRRL Y-2227) TaxID=1333698 RepID=A0A8J2T9C1_ZYGB2|nr:UGX2 (YDL169C) [Zygosaccharomyces parabailii]CDF91231.1 ZYBA0S10-02652g1_1 [Zygosaccharomyces bailii CLIB 213]CDH17001.1 uncharacterized protein ZBAI_08789 [Zygosaccharomyces bailii ISA1307]SJM88259.1 uncharacterized protein ZBIST_4448 [Zygosaccharomyces bailii]